MNPGSPTIDEMLARARAAAAALRASATSVRDDALEHIATALAAHRDEILAANASDVAAARAAGTSPPMLDRLTLTAARLDGVIRAVREVRALPDPLSEERPLGTRPSGIRVARRRIPLGVLAVVYEARPNVTVEAGTLALKSGNAIVLRGGREAAASNAALVAAVRAGLERAGLPADAVQRVADTSRERVAELLGAAGRVDLAIPRGGAALMKMVDEYARVPVLRHGEGVTHMFLDASADGAMAARLAVNAKAQRPGVCNALETLLVHRELLDNGVFLQVARELAGPAGVELRVDDEAARVLTAADVPYRAAEPRDWDTEYLALTLAVRVVPSLDAALAHIARHGTQHTAAIVTEHGGNAERFLREVDASCVLWNASTRFNDGGELGLGAEIGISTTKLHAFGPMGLRELTAEKFVVYGAGQARA